MLLAPQDVLMFNSLNNNMSEKEAIGIAGTENERNAAELQKSETKMLNDAAALPPLQIRE